MDISKENLATLVRDGISEEIYKLLWARDDMNFGPNINVPDTIIYKYGQPVTWYFTSLSGRVKKKNKHNLLSAKIEEVFNKHVLGYDVIAYFITMSSEHERSANDAPTPTVIEYFDREGLKNFLYNNKKGVNGILQRFIEPKSTHNELIRAIWSPKLCLLERAENIHQLHDHRFGLYERCVVYEGPDYYFTSAPLRGPVLSGQLQKICESVVHHISEVTYGQKQITRIVLNFKVDSRDKIWFLYSTSIRSDDALEYKTMHEDQVEKHLVNIDSVVTLPDTINLNPKKSYSKIVPKTRVACLSCNTETLDDLRYPVSYKSVMKHYDHVLHLLKTSAGTTHAALTNTASSTKGVVVPWPPDSELIVAAGGVGFGCLLQDDDVKAERDRHRTPGTHHVKYKNLKDVVIPPMISALHPKLTSETYLRCKTDPLFQNKSLHVCEACFLVYAEFMTMLLRMGGSLTKLLTPDVDAPWTASSSTAKSSTFERPSSADWRAISTAMSQTRDQEVEDRTSIWSRTAARNLDEAKSRAIGLRTSDMRFQPEVPSPIRTATDSANALRSQHSIYSESGATGMRPGSPEGSTSLLFNGGLLDLGSQSLHEQINGYDQSHVHAMIAERERKFFKEISLNPQLRDQHPLMHLITAQQRLELVDQQSGVLMSKAATAQESVFPAKFGHQTSDRHQKFGPYGAPLPYAVNGEIILPSALRARKRQEIQAARAKKKESLRKYLQADEAMHSSASVGVEDKSSLREDSKLVGAAPSDGSVKSSKQYRDFLADSLQRIEQELGQAASYAPASENDGSHTGEGEGQGKGSRKSQSVASKRKVVARKGDDQRPVATAPAGMTKSSPAPEVHGGARNDWVADNADGEELPRPLPSEAYAMDFLGEPSTVTGEEEPPLPHGGARDNWAADNADGEELPRPLPSEAYAMDFLGEPSTVTGEEEPPLPHAHYANLIPPIAGEPQDETGEEARPFTAEIGAEAEEQGEVTV